MGGRLKMRDDLGKRMKENYEHTAQTTLPKRLPTIIRLDGKAFHAFTANCERPFDKTLHDTMVEVTKYLCENIQTCVFGYTQSDEISLLLHPYKKLDTQPWFGNNVQKITSVSASFATAKFNQLWLQEYFAVDEFSYKETKRPNVTEHFNEKSLDGGLYNHIEVGDIINYMPLHQTLAFFDSRVFVLPEAEVCNYFIWRQQDATRNSKQMLARSLYSHKECENKNGSELQDMCMEKGHNWNDLDTWKKRGTAMYKIEEDVPRTGSMAIDILKTTWTADYNIPIFSQDRNFIEQHLKTESE
jgi:tRNA(His) 5'-end guanylyltransferase